MVEREGRVGYDAVERREPAALQYLGIPQRVALHDAEVRGTVQEEVHLRDRRVHRVLLLAEDAPEAEFGVAHVADRFDEHAARAACGIVHALPGLRIENAHKQLHNGTGRVEFAGLGLGLVGELLQEDFVRIAHQVGGVVLVPELPL